MIRARRRLSPSKVEVLVWVLVYGGLLVAGVGWALHRQAHGWGLGLAVAGGLAAAAGVALIWIRSRMSNEETT